MIPVASNSHRVGHNAVMTTRSGSGSRADHAYREIRALLMSGEISPWERLSEESLAAMCHVSRTPVREALRKLESDGLIQRRSGGLYPYLPHHSDLAHLYEARILIETHGVLAPHPRDVERVSRERDQWLALRDRMPDLDAGFVTRDEQFHVELLASAGNPFLVEMLGTINHRIRPVRMYDYLTSERMNATVTEHLAIADLVLAGDAEAAADALITHIENSRDVVVQRAAHRLLP